MVQREKLQDETWLVTGTKYTDPRFVVFDRMFVPYILIPFLAMGKKNYALVRKLLSENACNCEAGEPRWDHLMAPGLQRLQFFVKHVIKTIIINNYFDPVRQARNLLKSKDSLDFMEFDRRMLAFASGLDVTPPGSGYVTYYNDKNEAFDFENQTGWTAKQKNIYELINEVRPKRILDIGANTGWFSILAAKLGSEVIATDIDESSIDLLYIEAKKEGLKILPLLLSFDDLERKIFGVSCNEKEYKGRDYENIPLFLSATERINSDVVLCLGLLHHLVLGMGRELDFVFEILSRLTRRTLVLEFVDLKDKLVQGEPSFFKNINRYSEINYNMNIVIAAGLKYFKSVRIADSDPETRKLLIFNNF
jgi:SAM-dependent methyltransferase